VQKETKKRKRNETVSPVARPNIRKADQKLQVVCTSLNAQQLKQVSAKFKINDQLSTPPQNFNQVLIIPSAFPPRVPKVLFAIAFDIPIVDLRWLSQPKEDQIHNFRFNH